MIIERIVVAAVVIATACLAAARTPAAQLPRADAISHSGLPSIASDVSSSPSAEIPAVTVAAPLRPSEQELAGDSLYQFIAHHATRPMTAGELAFLKAPYYLNTGLGPSLSRDMIQDNMVRQFALR